MPPVKLTADRLLPAEVSASLRSSLPVSASGEEDARAIGLIDGSEGWPQRVASAVNGGAIGAVVFAPTLTAATELGDNNRPVLVEWDHASDPLVDAFARNIGGVDRHVRIDVRVVTAVIDWRHLVNVAALASQLCAERSLRFHVDHYAAKGFHLSATAASADLEIDVARTSAKDRETIVRAMLPDKKVLLRLNDPNSARPSQLEVMNDGGIRKIQGTWESAHRIAVRRFIAWLDDIGSIDLVKERTAVLAELSESILASASSGDAWAR